MERSAVHREQNLKLWVVLNRAQRAIEDRLREQVQSAGLNFSEFATLEVLLHKGPLPLREVADRVLLAGSSTTYVIDKLVAKGFLRREVVAADRRVILAVLTEEGRALIERVFEEHATLIDQLFEVASPEEVSSSIQTLKTIGHHARAATIIQ